MGINIKSMEDALEQGDLDRAGRCCGFLRAFWDVHGGEGDEMGGMPRDAVEDLGGWVELGVVDVRRVL